MGKYRYPVILFIVGFALVVIWMPIHISHWPGQGLIKVAAGLIVIAMAWTIILSRNDAKYK